MKLPTIVYSHWLAYPNIKMDEPGLRAALAHSRDVCGYGGMVFVPALVHKSLMPKKVALIYRDEGMLGIACGFNAGDGPDPLKDGTSAAFENLKLQAQFAVALAEESVGPAIMAGPMQAHHQTQRPDWVSNNLSSSYRAWLRLVNVIGRTYGLRMCCEVLNEIEEGTPDPYSTLERAIIEEDLTNVGLHLDTGHFHMRGMNMKDFERLAPITGLMEFANMGRQPLHHETGIRFLEFVKRMHLLRDSCHLSDEPFHVAVIKAFGLENLCDTTTDGLDCLRMDALFLESLLVKITPFLP